MIVYVVYMIHTSTDYDCVCVFQNFGIPQHFGLFYAMGMALCMEGVMSACYHVCPTVSNFQFGRVQLFIFKE